MYHITGYIYLLCSLCFTRPIQGTKHYPLIGIGNLFKISTADNCQRNKLFLPPEHGSGLCCIPLEASQVSRTAIIKKKNSKLQYISSIKQKNETKGYFG